MLIVYRVLYESAFYYETDTNQSLYPHNVQTFDLRLPIGMKVTRGGLAKQVIMLDGRLRFR